LGVPERSAFPPDDAYPIFCGTIRFFCFDFVGSGSVAIDFFTPAVFALLFDQLRILDAPKRTPPDGFDLDDCPLVVRRLKVSALGERPPVVVLVRVL